MMKIYTRCFISQARWILNTVEPRFNEPLYNELLGLTKDFHQPGQNYSKMYGTESLYKEPRFNEYFSCFPQNSLNRGFRYNALDITNTFPQSIGTSLNRGSTVLASERNFFLHKLKLCRTNVRAHKKMPIHIFILYLKSKLC